MHLKGSFATQFQGSVATHLRVHLCHNEGLICYAFEGSFAMHLRVHLRRT